MQTYSEEDQMCLYDPGLWCGKTSLEPSPAGNRRGRTSGLSSKKLFELSSIPYQFLDLTPGAGNLLGVFYWEILSPWRGASLTLNTGASPRDAAVSTLWQILEDKPHPRYYLTRKACLGILRRSSERDKPLPTALRSALELQAGLREDVSLTEGKTAFAANQRDEVRDLHDVAGALGAQPGMKQQTFIAESAPVLCLNDQGGQVMNCSVNITGTLRAQERGHQPLVYENHGIDSRYTGPHEVSPTISARCGTGGNNVPLVEQDASIYCIVGNIIDRQPENGGNGCGYQKGISYTLTAMDRHAIYSRQRVDVFAENKVACTESARQHKDATDLVMQPYQETVGTLVRSDHKGISNQYVSDDKCILDSPNLIRRLTPLECECLQGFLDGWTKTSPGLRIPPVTKPWATVWPSPAWSTSCGGLRWYCKMNAVIKAESQNTCIDCLLPGLVFFTPIP